MNFSTVLIMQYCLFVYGHMSGFAVDLSVAKVCVRCVLKFHQKILQVRARYKNVKIKEEEFFSPFQHYEKPFGHIRLSVTTSNLWEPKELNSIFSLFKLYIDAMSRILVHHCDVFIIPILYSGLKASIEDGASYENRRDKITASVFWRVRELAKRLTIQTCQSVDPDFIRFVFYNYNYGKGYQAHCFTK